MGTRNAVRLVVGAVGAFLLFGGFGMESQVDYGWLQFLSGLCFAWVLAK
jgi:hypothetical protein